MTTPTTRLAWKEAGWWRLPGRILARMLLAALAYIAAVLATLVAVVITSTFLSIAGAPDPFGSFGLPPFMALLVPTIGLFVYLLSLIVAAGPALLAVIVTEGLALRQLWLHSLLGAAVSASTFAHTMATTLFGLGGQDIADYAIMAASGLFGGLVYWLIAGRRAGGVGRQDRRQGPDEEPGNAGKR